MTDLNTLDNPRECNLLIAFADMTNFATNTRKMNSLEIFEFIDEFAEITGDIVEGEGGKVVKLIGDSSLIVFTEERVSIGIRTLKLYKEKIDNWLKEKGFSSRLIVKANYGEVTCGPLGIKGNKIFDIMGEAVNIAAMTPSRGFAITPQVFRKLDKDTKTLFEKHTPPITYIDIKESHRE